MTAGDILPIKCVITSYNDHPTRLATSTNPNFYFSFVEYMIHVNFSIFLWPLWSLLQWFHCMLQMSGANTHAWPSAPYTFGSLQAQRHDTYMYLCYDIYILQCCNHHKCTIEYKSLGYFIDYRYVQTSNNTYKEFEAHVFAFSVLNINSVSMHVVK